MNDLVRHLRNMALNNQWANRRLLSACSALEPGEFSAPRTGFFPSIRETLAHNLMIDLYYLDALEEGGNGQALRRSFRPPKHAADLAFEQEQADRRLVAFCERLKPQDLRRRVATDRGGTGIVPERIEHLLAHLFQHQIHHRGQAHCMLSGTSVPPPQLDEFFLDYDRAPDAPPRID